MLMKSQTWVVYSGVYFQDSGKNLFSDYGEVPCIQILQKMTKNTIKDKQKTADGL